MAHRIFLPQETDLLDFGAHLSKQLTAGDVVFLQGELGAGKTTLVRGLLRALEPTTVVKSPTFTLLEHYELAGRIIYHFDLYRLTRAEELLEIGVQDYFSTDAVCLVEWPEKGAGVLPMPSYQCFIEIPRNSQGRWVTWKPVHLADRLTVFR